MRLRPCACLALAAALAACASSDGPRALHQWTDAAGNVRYTAFPEDIPGAQAHTSHRVDTGVPVRRAPPLDVAAASPPEELPFDAPPDAPLDARIAELEARIETDQEALAALISDPAAAATLRGSPELREIADRLPALQRELAELRDRRAAAALEDGE